MGIATHDSTLAIGFSFPIITALLIALRFYTRWHQKTDRQIDDWLCLPAWVCLTACCACLLTGELRNAFIDQPISSPEEATPGQVLLAQVVFALVKLWILSNYFIKLTILFFYRRIFIGRIFNICTWALIGLSTVWLIYSFICSVLYCGTNVHANAEGGWAVCPLWGFGIQMGTFCLDSFIDFCLLLLPIPFVWHLQLSLPRKFLIVIIFLLGGFAFVAGLNNTVVQLVELLEPAVAEKGNFFQGSWLLFYNWPVIEIGVGLIACNLPTISYGAARSLVRQVRRGWTVSRSGLRRISGHGTRGSRSSRGEREEGDGKGRRGTGSTLVGVPVRWRRSGRGSVAGGGEVVSISDIPLVERKLKAESPTHEDGDQTARYHMEPVDDRNGRVYRKGDIV